MSKNNYRIPFSGLKIGKHEFDFDITDTFFDSFEYSIINKGNVKVSFELEKKETMMIGLFSFNGNVIVDCDRCGDELELPIEGEFKLVYKFTTEPVEDESLVAVGPDEFFIDIKHSILEFLMVSLPGRAVHQEGDCNPEMMAVMEEYLLVSDDGVEESDDEEDDVDPRWDALNKLK